MELKIGDEFYYCNAKPKYTNGVKGYEIYYQKVTITELRKSQEFCDWKEVWFVDETGYKSSMYEDCFVQRYAKNKKDARKVAIEYESVLFKQHVDRLNILMFGEDKDESNKG